ncbi:MAG: hypothetical protein R2867_11475 [Caldilineaceae bacterium]
MPLLFSAVITGSFFGDLDLLDYLFAILAVAVVRPLAVWLALLGSRLSRAGTEIGGRLVWTKGCLGALWLACAQKRFGAPLILLFHLIAVVVISSIVAHSSTDVLVAHRVWGKENADSATGQ